MAISVSTLLLLGLVALLSALSGAALVGLGAWIIYTVRLVERIKRRGDLYLSDWDNERARQLRHAHELSTALTHLRQALKHMSAEMASEFYPSTSEPVIEQKNKTKGQPK